MAEAKDSQLKIVNPSRINRLLQRICQASMQVLIRTDGPKSIAIRGRAASLSVEGPLVGLRLSNISEQGMSYLAGRREIHVEFVGMSTHVVFDSAIVVRERNSILVALPAFLTSMERRKNARFVCTPEQMSYVRLGLWNAAVHDIGAPPVFPHFADQSSWISIGDLSEGGICALTRFPSPVAVLRSGLIDDHAKLYLPMQPALNVRLEIRWIRRIKETIKVDGSNRFQRSFRFGAQFVALAEDHQLLIRQYMQQLTTAGAV